MGKGFVYKWTNQVNGKWYIGSHKGSLDDGYRHSSKILAAAERKYGLDNFFREILFEGDYEIDQIRSTVEARFLQEEDAANNPLSYNQSNITGPNRLSKEACKKISDAKLGVPMTPEHSIKKSIAQKGLKRSSETRERISKAKQGKNNPMYGKQLTTDHRRKVSEGLKAAYASGKRTSSQLGVEPWNKGKIPEVLKCPHCQREGKGAVMYRHHFDRCSKSLEI